MKLYIDGNNIGRSHGDEKISLRSVLSLCLELKREGHNYVCYFDANAWRITDEPDGEKIVTELLKHHNNFRTCPARNQVDRYILDGATIDNASIISNDQYREFLDSSHTRWEAAYVKYSWLKKHPERRINAVIFVAENGNYYITSHALGIQVPVEKDIKKLLKELGIEQRETTARKEPVRSHREQAARPGSRAFNAGPASNNTYQPTPVYEPQIKKGQNKTKNNAWKWLVFLLIGCVIIWMLFSLFSKQNKQQLNTHTSVPQQPPVRESNASGYREQKNPIRHEQEGIKQDIVLKDDDRSDDHIAGTDQYRSSETTQETGNESPSTKPLENKPSEVSREIIPETETSETEQLKTFDAIDLSNVSQQYKIKEDGRYNIKTNSDVTVKKNTRVVFTKGTSIGGNLIIEHGAVVDFYGILISNVQNAGVFNNKGTVLGRIE